MPSENPTVRSVDVPPQYAGERVDRIASLLFTDHSRVSLAHAIEAGRLTVDGLVVKPKLRLHGGERLLLDLPPAAPVVTDVAQPMPLDILHEDDDVIVLHKPAGMVVHPGAGNPDRTLVNALLAYRPGLDLLPRAGIVHRLDKETSGVMIVATSARAHKFFIEALAERRVRRKYVAIVEGRLVSGADYREPIGRDPHHRVRQAVREDGKPAHTSVRVDERFRAHTCVQVELHTGRTHQIRVHLAHAGYPLVGDHTYGARGRLPQQPTRELVDTIRRFRRQALHAQALSFTHPDHGEEMHFTAPWPTDLINLRDVLRSDAAQTVAR
jgi:23S rRNA pseudouridine1911/1915/1917 synthase